VDKTLSPASFATEQAMTTLRLIVLAGLAAGALDALYFSLGALLTGKSPVFVLKSIASFWLGKDAFQGGAASATLGLATHFALATLMAAGFVAARPLLPWLRGPVVQAGLIWGATLYAIMYLAVLPLRFPALYPKWNGWTSAMDVGVHLAVGVVIAAITLPGILGRAAATAP
jgi:hypothetical protein